VSAFRSIVFDVDSTLTGIEGIDWLAARRGLELAAEIAELTQQAMDGSVPIDKLYGVRLDMVRPTRQDLAELAVAYQEKVASSARALVLELADAGLQLRIISGGIRGAVLPFAQWLGIPAQAVHAVEVQHDPAGRYRGWDAANPLATATGKGTILKSLGLPGPILGVGDGITDLSLRAGGASVAAYTGFVRRDVVVREADHLVASFDELRSLVLP
jgi:phosphoserine phosphatase